MSSAVLHYAGREYVVTECEENALALLKPLSENRLPGLIRFWSGDRTVSVNLSAGVPFTVEITTPAD